jgi:hypothetical protein
MNLTAEVISISTPLWVKGVLICINCGFSAHFPRNIISNATGNGVIHHLNPYVSVLVSPLEDDLHKSWLFVCHKSVLDRIHMPDILEAHRQLIPAVQMSKIE